MSSSAAARSGRLPAFILHWNAPADAAAAAVSLMASTGVSVEVTVIDNASEPAQFQVLQDRLPAGVALHRLPANLGFSGAANAALGLAQAAMPRPEHVLIVAHDVEVDPDCLGYLLDAGRRWPQFGALGPLPATPHGPQPVRRLGWDVRRGPIEGELVPVPAPGEVIPMDWITGRVMLLRADAVAAIGGFDNRLFVYCEDLDLCLRLGDMGARSGLVAGALAWDRGHMSSPRRYQYYISRNRLAISASRGSRWAQAQATAWSVRYAARDGLASLWPGHSPARRRVARELAIGIAWGTVDALRGRMGPLDRS